MNIKVKYHLFPENQQSIRCLALNQDYLAFSSGKEENWLSLYIVQKTSEEPMIFKKLESPTQGKRPISFLSWSPKGNYLASACDVLTIWQLSDLKLKKHQEYQDHSLEIMAIAWSPDGSRIATCSLDAHVVINDITTKTKIKVIECGKQAMGITWDPLDRYVASLLFDNKVVVWKTTNFEQHANVCLNLSSGEKLTSKREDRRIDWSPDCQYLLVPSMDDKEVPVVCALDRNSSFKVVKTFLGPFSSVNAVKFSPVLYNQEGVKNVFAMGDNDGNISFWHLNQKGPEKPILLLKSNQGELIEDIGWSTDGKSMMATTMRQYLIIVNFCEDGVLGQPLTLQDQRQLLIKKYGTADQVSSSTSNISSIRTFSSQDRTEQKSQALLVPTPTVVEPPQERVFTDQSISVVNGKKRIVPKMQVSQPLPPTNPPSTPVAAIQQAPMTPTPKLDAVQVPPPVQQLVSAPQPFPHQYNQMLSNGQSLMLEFIKGTAQQYTMIKCGDKRDVKWADIVEGQVLHLQLSQKFIVVYTQKGLLYVSNMIGKRMFPPASLPGVCKLQMSDKCNLLLINENADFRVLSLTEERLIMEGDIRNLLTDGNQIMQVYLQELADGSEIPYILLKDGQLCYYDHKKCMWFRSQKMEVNQVDNIKLDQQLVTFNSKKAQIKQDKFFQKLVLDDTNFQRGEAISDVQQIAELEEKLSQLILLNDPKNFLNQIYQYVKKLCDTLPLNKEKLHDILLRTTDRTNSEEMRYFRQFNISADEVKKNISYVLSQYPNAKDFKLLIE